MKSILIAALGILWIGLAPSARAAAIGSSYPGPGAALGTNDVVSLRTASTQNLTKFKAHITPTNYRLMGFEATNEVLTATNGEPLLVFALQFNQVTNYRAGIDFSLLLDSSLPPRAMVPIMAGTNVRSSTSLRLAAGASAAALRWVEGDWGHPKLIRDLTAAYRALPRPDISPNTIPFVVEIPMPRIFMVGYFDRQGNLVLRPVVDLRFGALTLRRNEPMTEAGMAMLAAEARRYDPALPN